MPCFLNTRTFNTNLKAVVNVSQVVAKEMIRAGTGGSIVNMSSVVSEHINFTRLVRFMQVYKHFGTMKFVIHGYIGEFMLNLFSKLFFDFFSK